MAGSATISSCFSLIANNGIGGKEKVSMTFTSSKIMAGGCTLGAVIVDTTDNTGGATLTLKNGATTMLAGATSTAPATKGIEVLALTPTAADLALAPADTMVFATQAQDSANRVEFVMYQPSPRTVAVT